MKSDIKISYLNIISRHRYFNDVKCELNLNSSDVVILSEKKNLSATAKVLITKCQDLMVLNEMTKKVTCLQDLHREWQCT